MSEDSFAKLCADLVAESPHKTEAEHRHTLELRHGYRMADPALRAVLEQAIKQNGKVPPLDGDADNHEVDDTDADKAAYDYEPDEDSRSLAGGFTEPGVEGKLAEFEATPPGKSAGCQKLISSTHNERITSSAPVRAERLSICPKKRKAPLAATPPRRLLPCPMQ
jgi:hypothetical protein